MCEWQCVHVAQNVNSPVMSFWFEDNGLQLPSTVLPRLLIFCFGFPEMLNVFMISFAEIRIIVVSFNRKGSSWQNFFSN